MTNAITLSNRIKYITGEDDDGPVGVLVYLGDKPEETVVKEVLSQREFQRIYKSLRNMEVLDELVK
jgi:hypothetical protein